MLGLSISSLMPAAGSETAAGQAALEVVKRFDPELAARITFEPLPPENGCPAYEYEAKDNQLHVKATTNAAACKGVYDYLKAHGLGIYSWSGNRTVGNTVLPDSKVVRKTSPVPFHYYLNVVTFGYSTAYWDWRRWEKEIDYMAFHGYDFPLALCANEAIAIRVWRKLGLTEEEINEFYVGPAHLPWQRMGNIINHDGPLPASWHEDQIELEHKIIDRLKELGMTPVFPAFAGFVPRGLKRLYPEIKISELSWSTFAEKNHSWLLSPDEPLFVTIGNLFIQEWEKEFGKGKYYLADSFNEMDLPVPKDDPQAKHDLLARYGNAIFRSIAGANPDAVWTLQGWMFGYHRHEWTPEALAALVSTVPDEQMLILDLAVNYNKFSWKTSYNCDFFDGFFNKQWIYSTIPNMGGRNCHTGTLDFFANGHLEVLDSPHRGNLVGIGTAPEGIENNEMVYEMMADATWSDQKIDVTAWMNNYGMTRYGKCPEVLKESYQLLHDSRFNNFKAPDSFNWQSRPGLRRFNDSFDNTKYIESVQKLLEAGDELRDNPLYIADALEFSAMVLGIKMEELSLLILEAVSRGDAKAANERYEIFAKLGMQADALLEHHPYMRLEHWTDFARMHGETPELKDYYEANARRLVTIWGPPINDYALKFWSGLIRDYYLQRWKRYIDETLASGKANLEPFEESFVASTTLSEPMKIEGDLLTACRTYVAEALKLETKLPEDEFPVIGNVNFKALPYDQWETVEYEIDADTARAMQGVRFIHMDCWVTLKIRKVMVNFDGTDVAICEQDGIIGAENHNNFVRLNAAGKNGGNNSCSIRAEVCRTGGDEGICRVELIK